MNVPPVIQTYSGRMVNLDHPTPDRVSIEDLSHALAHTNRFCGHTRYVNRPWWDRWAPDGYSVAQHSVLCSVNAPGGYEFEALMHDAHEAYVGDMASPLKGLLPSFVLLEKAHAVMLRRAFYLPDQTTSVVKELDLRALMTERRDMMAPGPTWSVTGKPFRERIKPWSARRAKREFEDRFFELWDSHREAVGRHQILGMIQRVAV